VTLECARQANLRLGSMSIVAWWDAVAVEDGEVRARRDGLAAAADQQCSNRSERRRPFDHRPIEGASLAT